MDVLSRLDLVFCVDLTGSMGGFIGAAKAHMLRILDALRTELGDGLRVGFVGYRDYSDGDKLLDVQELTGDLDRIKKVVAGLSVSGGGDAPEAVFAGLQRSMGLAWAEGSYRTVLLVADAPPHACGAPGDSYAAGDPTGFTVDDMANLLETEGVFVHALAMSPHDRILEESFRRLSISTGGGYHDATTSDAAIEIVEMLTKGFLREIDFDRRLLEKLRAGVPEPVPSHDDEVVPSRAEILAKTLGVAIDQVHSGVMRLRQRRLWQSL